jgi:hypothetical protein
MSAPNYIELHARSAFSFLEGSSLPEDLIEQCAAFDQPAMALVDAHGVYGCPRFHMAARKARIRAHIGAEVGSTMGGRLVLLAESRAGYQNLCQLITRTKLSGPKPGKIEDSVAASTTSRTGCPTKDGTETFFPALTITEPCTGDGAGGIKGSVGAGGGVSTGFGVTVSANAAVEDAA